MKRLKKGDWRGEAVTNINRRTAQQKAVEEAVYFSLARRRRRRRRGHGRLPSEEEIGALSSDSIAGKRAICERNAMQCDAVAVQSSRDGLMVI